MERIGNEVARTLDHAGGGGETPLAALVTAWPEAVGEAVARNSWPLRLGRDGTLHVATSSATWAFELDRMAGDVLGALRLRVGDATPPRLRFAVGPIPEPAAAEERTAGVPRAPSAAPPEVELEASRAASAIEDPDLRELVARAARASLLRARSGRPF
jgi:predicted nucleic acid-binding Zn ribbon protein